MNMKPIVLVVDDSALILEINDRIFKRAGYEVLLAKTLDAARGHLKKSRPDAVILDILLPDGNGLDFIREIRRKTRAPVLLVTSRNSRDERMRGFRAGGDDYITKPFDPDELAARVSSFLRREAMYHQDPFGMIIRGPFLLDTTTGIAFLNGREMGLTQKEFRMLLFLIRHEGRLCTIEKIYKEIWKSPMSGDIRTVRTTISRLRKKIEDHDGVFIESIRGEGYQFVFYG